MIKYTLILRSKVTGMMYILKNSLTPEILVARRQYRRDIAYKPKKLLLSLYESGRGKKKWEMEGRRKRSIL